MNAAEREGEEIHTYLKCGDWAMRRRALWRMTHGGSSADRVIDEFVGKNIAAYEDTPINQVLQVLGKRALPRLYYHLKRTEKGYARFRIFEAIVLLGEPDAAGRRALGELAKDSAEDADLEYMLLILRAGASRGNDADAIMAKVLQEPVRSSIEGGPLWPFVAYDSTRARALEEARNRLKNGLAALKSESNRDVDYRTDVLAPLFALFSATRLGALTPADAALLGNPRTELSEVGWRDSPPPPLLMARWRAGGRAEQRRLDELLKVASASRPSDGVLVYLMYMADHMLSSDDVPALVARAADATAKEEIRHGAVALLALTGTLPKDATKTLLRLTASESETLSLVAAVAMGAILENPADTAELVRAVRSRAEDEERPRVRHALDKSIEILVGSSEEVPMR